MEGAMNLESATNASLDILENTALVILKITLIFSLFIQPT